MTIIVDTSALIHAWRGTGRTRASLEQAARGGDVVIIEPVRLEVLRGVGSPAEAQQLLEWLGEPYAVTVKAEAWARAERTLVRLARLRGGRHRGLAVTDLLVAAVADATGVPVLHRDRDFDLIASVTGQPVRWFGAPA